MNESIENYIKFVQEVASKYKKNVDILQGNSEITPYTINEALANYSNILFILTSEYQRKKAEAYEIQIEFEAWWDEKFTEKRRTLNDVNLPASKWVSKQEIESEVRSSYKSDYKDWKTKLFEVENKVTFYKQLLDNWKKFDSILITLSYNMRSELKSLSLEDRANKTLDEEAKAHTNVPTRRRKVVD